MENLHIETPYNVRISQNFASAGSRIIAQLVDFIFIGGYIFVITRFLNLLEAENFSVFLVLLPVIFYSLLFEYFMEGQTPGKKAMGICVSKTDGTPAGIGNYLLRWVFRIIDIWIFSGIIAVLLILITDRKQRLGDLAAGTTVIRFGESDHRGLTVFRELGDDYIPKYPKAARLEENEVKTLAEVLEFWREHPDNEVKGYLRKTVNALEKKLHIQKDKDIPDHVFIEKIIRDYNYYNTR